MTNPTQNWRIERSHINSLSTLIVVFWNENLWECESHLPRTDATATAMDGMVTSTATVDRALAVTKEVACNGSTDLPRIAWNGHRFGSIGRHVASLSRRRKTLRGHFARFLGRCGRKWMALSIRSNSDCCHHRQPSSIGKSRCSGEIVYSMSMLILVWCLSCTHVLW